MAMDDEPLSALKRSPVPPPDLPPPSIPSVPPPSIPPNIPPPSLPPVWSATPPPPPASEPQVRIAIKEGGEEEGAASELAPFNTRVIAAVIDILISIGVQVALVIVSQGFMNRLGWVVGLAYLLTRDSLPFLGGQSVGKKAMHLKVVTLDGKPLTGNWEPGLIRNAVLCIPFVGMLLELFILLTREGKPDQGRRLGDEWGKTKVIVVPVEAEKVNGGS
ncbi:MAG: hypothetical protein CFE26_04530 [Verrucomicrobiales bacterium VVV1]|nr:MAG: hypothetical protein CFE26_04530 [Verrucomicrobiales bacterium VVV1]